MATDVTARARLLLQELLHPEEMDRFVAACVPTSVEDFAGLRLRTQHYLAWARREATASATLDLETATAIARVLLAVLDEPTLYDDGQRALLHGATTYFLDSEDDANDITDVLGFDDDARVLNAVLDAIGRKDLRIELA